MRSESVMPRAVKEALIKVGTAVNLNTGEI